MCPTICSDGSHSPWEKRTSLGRCDWICSSGPSDIIMCVGDLRAWREKVVQHVREEFDSLDLVGG